ncbi:DNA repair and recombination RAD54-like protein, partial [Trifolium pratense]
MRLRCGRTRELRSHRNCGAMRLRWLPHQQYCGRNCGCGPQFKTVQPKRYVGCDVEKLEVGNFRTWPYKRPTYVTDDENSSDSEEDDGKSDENSSKNDHLTTNDANELNLDPCSIQTTMSNINDVEVDDRVSLGDFYSFGKEILKRKRFHGSDDMDFENKWEGIHFKNGAQTKRYHSIFTSREHLHEEQ